MEKVKKVATLFALSDLMQESGFCATGSRTSVSSEFWFVFINGEVQEGVTVAANSSC